MISPITLNPNMESGTMANAINENFNQLRAENRVKVIRDSNGVNRMILGQWDTGQYGLLGSDEDGVRRFLIGQNPKTGVSGFYMSIEGVDVIDELMA